jgi:hypothetical protein
MKKFKITEKGINFLLIFILGFLVGVALKSEAQKRITIGYSDYLVPKYKQDINPLEKPAAQPQNQDQSDQNAPTPEQTSPQDTNTAPDSANQQ